MIEHINITSDQGRTGVEELRMRDYERVSVTEVGAPILEIEYCLRLIVATKLLEKGTIDIDSLRKELNIDHNNGVFNSACVMVWFHANPKTQ